jgi:hypothetical protein
MDIFAPKPDEIAGILLFPATDTLCRQCGLFGECHLQDFFDHLILPLTSSLPSRSCRTQCRSP